MKFLLDNDVFLSAIYRKHESHAGSRAWLDAAKREGWGIAAETYLAAIRLLMNPSVMGSGAFTAHRALDAVDAELAGSHPGQVVMAQRKPDRRLLERAEGHHQVMDIWLLQIARDSGSRLATRDAGILSLWPEDSQKVP